MNAHEKVLARWQFQAQVARLNGMAFQNFFSHMMGLARPGFAPVKPQGNQGDWKNDGHEPELGRYYQVYAPEVYDESAAIKKLGDDFAGLLTEWAVKAVYPSGVVEFYFVINDAYRITPGVYPSTYATLEALRQGHGLKICKPMLAKDLEEICLGMDEDKVWSMLGLPPDPAQIKVLRIDLVSDVVKHIVENPIERSLDEALVAPDFDKKIAFNGLTIAGGWLKAADYRRGTVEQYFSANSEFTRQFVRDKLEAIYGESKDRGFESVPSGATAADQQFCFILNEITPASGNDGSRLRKELQEAAIVVMAYFFETCDIFEEPA